MQSSLTYGEGIYSFSLQGSDYGVHTDGRTFEELLFNVKDAIKGHNERCLPYQEISTKDLKLSFNLQGLMHAIEV